MTYLRHSDCGLFRIYFFAVLDALPMMVFSRVASILAPEANFIGFCVT